MLKCKKLVGSRQTVCLLDGEEEKFLKKVFFPLLFEGNQYQNAFEVQMGRKFPRYIYV